MIVKNHLSGGLPVGLVQIQPLGSGFSHQGGSDPVSSGHDGVSVHLGQVKKVPGVSFGYDQCMADRPGLNIQESQHSLVFIELVSGEIPVYDLAENAIHLPPPALIFQRSNKFCKGEKQLEATISCSFPGKSVIVMNSQEVS
jgi:hypothetical protein